MFFLKNKKKFLIFFCLIIFIVPQIIFADEENRLLDEDTAGSEVLDQYQSFSGKAGFAIITQEPEELLGSIVQYILSFLGVIFTILIIYGGFLWMTARGDEEQIEKAKDIIKNSVIGLIIVLSAAVITDLVTNIGYGLSPA